MTLTADQRKRKTDMERARRAADPTYRERNREMQRKWRKQNPTAARAIDARASQHPARRARNLDWKERNKARRAEVDRIWRAANPGKIARVRQNRRARLNATEGQLSPGLAERLFALQKGRCACCGAKLVRYHMDHIVPLALGGPNVDSNIQLLAPRCNHQKKARHPIEFMQSRGKLL